MAETALRGTLWLLLGGWVGGWMLFGAVVAPTAFRELPSTELAGRVVGPVLTSLHLYGGGAGIALSGIAAALGRPRLLVLLPLALSALCLVSQFGVSGAIAELRAFGPEGSEDAAARFSVLHRVSVAIYLVVGIGALLLLGLHARADAPAAADPKPRKNL